MQHARAIEGCLLGCAVGDAIGLPFEGLSPRRVAKLLRRPLAHRLVFGRGMVSDDTDHSVFVAQSLIASGGDVRAFRSSLAWRLRWWFVCLPAGIGWATLRSILRLWLWWPRPGVYSAGNGPAMRSAIIGAYFCDDAAQRRAHVAASTQLTHTDPKALAGALAIAEIAAHSASGAWCAPPSVAILADVLAQCGDDPAWRAAVERLRQDCARSEPLADIAQRYGGRGGVTGFVLHTVPFAITAWYRHHGDYRATLEAVVRAGGDTDTAGAIAGAIAGASVGVYGIPQEWVDGIIDRPHGTRYLRRLAARLADPAVQVRVWFSPLLFLRGLAFTTIVLLHGFRRLLPPY